MITWAFAYMLVNGVAVPLWTLVAVVCVDIIFGQMLTDAIKGRSAVASIPDNSRNPDDHGAPKIDGYQPNKSGNNVEPIKPPKDE